MHATADAAPMLPSSRREALSIDTRLGLVIGLVLPLVAAALYRTYALSLSPAWVEITRQLGAPFVVGEIAIVVYARRTGFDIAAVVNRLDATTRAALVIFLATFWISSVFVAQAAFSVALCLIWIVHFYTAAAVSHLARNARLDARRLAPGFASGLAVLAPIVALHLVFAPVGAGPSSWLFGAPIPGFISIRLFGAWCGAVLTLLLGVALMAEHGRTAPRWLYPAIALAAALVSWSGTRAALAGVVVAMGVAVVFRRGADRRSWRPALTAVALGTMLGMIVPIANGAGSMLFRENALASADGFTSGRIELWTRSLAVAVHRPWLGHGMGSSWWLVALEGHYHVQPHNALVQFLLNWGLVPTAAALVLLGKAIWHIHATARRAPAVLSLVMTVDCLLVMSLLDGMLHFTRFLMLIAVLIGAILGERERL